MLRIGLVGGKPTIAIRFLKKVVSDKGRLWARHNTIFSMTWLGSPVVKKVMLSIRRRQLGSAMVCQGILRSANTC